MIYMYMYYTLRYSIMTGYSEHEWTNSRRKRKKIHCQINRNLTPLNGPKSQPFKIDIKWHKKTKWNEVTIALVVIIINHIRREWIEFSKKKGLMVCINLTCSYVKVVCDEYTICKFNEVKETGLLNWWGLDLFGIQVCPQLWSQELFTERVPIPHLSYTIQANTSYGKLKGYCCNILLYLSPYQLLFMLPKMVATVIIHTTSGSKVLIIMRTVANQLIFLATSP